jgi:hypothetical protein
LEESSAMTDLPPIPATYQRRSAEWVARKIKELPPPQTHDLESMRPRSVITVCCPVPGCGGHAGHLICYHDRWSDIDFWLHMAPAGYVRDDNGNAWKSKRFEERTELGRPLTGRLPHGRAGDLTTAQRGAYELVAESHAVEADAVMLSDCTNCDGPRPLVFSLSAALREA